MSGVVEETNSFAFTGPTKPHRGKLTNLYDFSGLVEKLKELLKVPQLCGLLHQLN